MKVALEFVEAKLEFMREHWETMTPAEPAGKVTNEQRRAWIRTLEMPLSAKQLVLSYEEKFRERLVVKTFMRDFKVLGAKKVGWGKYVVPGAPVDSDNGQVPNLLLEAPPVEATPTKPASVRAPRKPRKPATKREKTVADNADGTTTHDAAEEKPAA